MALKSPGRLGNRPPIALICSMLTVLATSQKLMELTFVLALLQILPTMSIFDIPLRLSYGAIRSNQRRIAKDDHCIW
jgi:hypothetical protein